jgi:hypothetical protein
MPKVQENVRKLPLTSFMRLTMEVGRISAVQRDLEGELTLPEFEVDVGCPLPNYHTSSCQ